LKVTLIINQFLNNITIFPLQCTGLEKAQKCYGVKPVNNISPLLIIGSLMAIQIETNNK
jgi:hypothetical protein